LRHEIGAAHIDRVSRSGVVSAVDAVVRSEALHGGAFVGAGVSLRDEERHAERRGRLRFPIFERDFGLASDGLAQAVTVGNNIRWLELQQIEYGKVEPRDGAGRSARGKLDVGVGSGYTRPLHIEGGFDLVPVLAGIRAVGINLLEVAVLETIQVEGVAELPPIGFMGEIGVFDQGNGDAFASEATVPERQNIVDGVEVVRAHGMERLSLILHVEVRMPLLSGGIIGHGAKLNGVRPGEKIVQ